MLEIRTKVKDALLPAPSEPIYGGYANRRGEISLFGNDVVYRVNFKNGTIQQRPQLNAAAQARYDATDAGDAFEYCSVSFRRLSSAEIADICASGPFRITPRAA